LWTFDTATNTAQGVRLTRRGAPAAEVVEHMTFNDRFQELSVSADGRKLAIVARGEIFAAASADGGAAVRITRTPAREFQPVWSPDSRRLAYVSARNRTWAIYLYDFTTQAEQLVTEGSRPLFSPDGKQLAFARTDQDRTELHVVDLATRQNPAPCKDVRQHATPALSGWRRPGRPRAFFVVVPGWTVDRVSIVEPPGDRQRARGERRRRRFPPGEFPRPWKRRSLRVDSRWKGAHHCNASANRSHGSRACRSDTEDAPVSGG
jgi:dipeptidyl aminopeptidase/acylaminoacyl peptidase